ncbi:MAG TPA: type II secretion system F family protein [Planctomycetota bacterium]|nr:type II secretion system F family protein [Planctomycetota bacterium]
MATFAFEARDLAGRRHAGVRAAASAIEAADALRRLGWLVLDLKPHSAAAPRRPRRGRRPAQRDVEAALRQLGLLLRSGLTLLEALRVAAEHARRPSMSRRLSEVADRIEAGASLAEALELHPREFPPVVRELVRAGEASGTLDALLERAASDLERQRELRSSVLQALFYPSIVLVLTGAVTMILLLEVIPVLETFLASSHRKLPAMTEVLLGASRGLREHFAAIAIVTAAVIFGVVALDRAPSTRPAMDRLLYRLPIVGRVRRLASTVLFARTLGVLLDSGVHVVAALRLLEGLLPRPVAARAIASARAHVLDGRALHEGLAGAASFTPLLPRMLAVGERSGQLSPMLAEAAHLHDAELRAWLKRASALIEPVLTVAVGTIVGFVYIAFFLALFAVAAAR